MYSVLFIFTSNKNSLLYNCAIVSLLFDTFQVTSKAFIISWVEPFCSLPISVCLLRCLPLHRSWYNFAIVFKFLATKIWLRCWKQTTVPPHQMSQICPAFGMVWGSLLTKVTRCKPTFWPGFVMSIWKQEIGFYKILLSRRIDWCTSRCIGSDDLRKYRSACRSFCIMHVEVWVECPCLTLLPIFSFVLSFQFIVINCFIHSHFLFSLPLFFLPPFFL